MTQVTVVMSSAANGWLAEYSGVVPGITLTSQSGGTVPLLAAPRGAEFIHLNGTLQPLATVDIPQDVYVTASMDFGAPGLTCVTPEPTGGLLINNSLGSQAPPSSVTLPTPIRVTGDSMGLALTLAVSPPASSCPLVQPGMTPPPVTVTSAFSLTPFALSAQQSDPRYSNVTALHGAVAAVNATSATFQIALPSFVSDSGGILTVSVGSGTTWQGVANMPPLSYLATGMFIGLDGTVQPDGSLAATRVSIADASAADVQTGPVLFVAAAAPVMTMFIREAQGVDQGSFSNVFEFNFAGASFNISPSFTNLQSLPFTPSFSAATMVAGQNVYLSSSAYLSVPNVQPTRTTAGTITLMPQMIDGTLSAISTSGNFSVYTVMLAPYDFFPVLAVQQGQTTQLLNPGQVEIYVNANTQTFNATPLALGSTLRFYGLVFNDNGVLRMDCARINDGVGE